MCLGERNGHRNFQWLWKLWGKGKNVKIEEETSQKHPTCLPLVVTAIKVVNGCLCVSPGNFNLCNLRNK